MKLYHRSSVPSLTVLKPFLSEHGKPYIYLASNPAVALLYAVKPVPKPFSYYPYGFDENGAVVYSEYWDNAFYELYNGKKGYLYECNDVAGAQNPTAINCAYTCESPIKIDDCTEIADIYEKFKEYEKEGLFKIKPFQSVSQNELNFVNEDMKKTIEKYNLRASPDNPMSKFIKEHFFKVWNNYDDY